MSVDIRKENHIGEIEAIALDMDGILSNPEFRSWLETTKSLAEHFGLKEKSELFIQRHKDFFKSYLKNPTPQNYTLMEKKLVNMWREIKTVGKNGDLNKPLNITKKELEKIIIKMVEVEFQEAKILIELIKNRGLVTALISGSYDLFIEMVAKYIRVEHVGFNSQLQFETNEFGEEILTGFSFIFDQEGLKVSQLKELARYLSVDVDQIVYIDDELGIRISNAGFIFITREDAKKDLKVIAAATISNVSKDMPSLLNILKPVE